MSTTIDGAAARRSEAGTTLVEALVVVSILTLLSLIGFPQLSGQMARLSGRQTAALVEARLREARAAAMHGDKAVRFAVTGDGREFGVAGEAPTSAPAGVVLSSASPAGIVFLGDGSSTGGSVRVDATGQSIVVTVAPVTGAIALGAA